MNTENKTHASANPAPDKALTRGCHHIGLSCADIEATAAFFIGLLGWRELLRDADYPAIFISDGVLILSLWQTADTNSRFDKHQLGLHHVAFAVASEVQLDDCYRRIQQAGHRIEFPPEPLRGGPAKHMICYEPGGIRVEIIHPAA